MKLNFLLVSISILFACQLEAQFTNKHLLLNTTGSPLDKAIIADFNNDGHDDCLMSLDGEFVWYETDTTGYWSTRHIIKGDPTYTPVAWKVGDVNSDGYTDIFYHKADITGVFTALRLNPGPGSDEWTEIKIPGFSITTLMNFSDIYGDGYPDMVYYDIVSHGVRCLKNTAGTFSVTVTLFTYTTPLENYVACDFDKDNLTDFIIRTNDGKITYLHANGDGTVSHTLLETESVYSLDFGDVNGDGYKDLLYNYTDLNYQLYEPATNTFAPKTTLGTFDSNNFTALDVNNDSFDDISWEVNVPGGNKKLLWSENVVGTFDLVDGVEMVDSLIEDAYIFYMDIDRNERIDIIADVKKNVEAYDQDITGIFSDAYEPDTAFDKIILTASADIDTNGTMDLVFINNQGVVGWLETDDSLHTILSAHPVPKLEGSPSPVSMLCLDIDMDGDSDLVASFRITDVGDKWSYYFLNDGAGQFTLYEFSTLAYRRMEMVDGNADGDLDLIALTDDGYLYMYQNTMDTAALFSSPVILGSISYDFILQDINADGFTDIVYSKYADDIQKLINTPDALYFQPTADYFHPMTFAPIALYTDDLDADGDMDYLYTDISDECFRVINNGGGSFSTTFIGDMNGELYESQGFTQLLDLNGDGTKDIIYASVDQGMSVKLSKGPAIYEWDYLNISPDFGRFLEQDIDDSYRFLGSNIFEFYICDNPIDPLGNINISAPTRSWLAENGAADSIIISLDHVPAESFNVSISPASMMNVGAGVGNIMSLSFTADSTALTPRVFYIYVDHVDSIPESAVTQSVSLHFDVPLSPELMAELDTTIQYLITDDDPGLFASASSLYLYETGVASTIQVKLNVYQTTSSSIIAIPDPEIQTNAGLGESVVMNIPAGAASVEPKSFSVVNTENYYDEGNTTGHVYYDIISGLAMLDTLAPIPLTITQIEDDDAGLTHISPSSAPCTEGSTHFTTRFIATSAPFADVLVVCDPDIQLDLGNGPGEPATIVFEEGEYSTEYKYLDGWAVDDGISEGAHTGMITYSIVSDDTAYTAYTFPDNTINIVDPGVVSVTQQVVDQPIITTMQDDLLLINAAGNNSSLSLYVFSYNGQTVYTNHFSGDFFQADLQTLADGNYIVYVTDGVANCTSRIQIR